MYRTLFITHYDDSEVKEDEPKDKPDGGDPSKTPEGKFMTQEHLDELFEKRVAKMKSENRQMLSKLESLQGSIKTDSEGREALEIELEELRLRTLSQDEITKREAKKASDKYTMDLEAAKVDAKTWQGEYNNLRIMHEINSASAKYKVLPESYEMVESFIRPHTKLVDVKDEDGNSTGSLESLVEFSDHDDDGKSITVQMTVPATLKRMSELPQRYGNLFEGQKISGTGGSSGSGAPSGKIDPSKLDTEAYIKFRKENPQAALGSF